MHVKKSVRAVAGALFALGLTSVASAQSYNQIVVFGDSLSDGGSYTPYVRTLGVPGAGSVTYFKFTTNQGNTWVEDIAGKFGLTLAPNAVVAGGTNYAEGGARVELPTAGSNAATPQLPIATQIDEYLASGQHFSSNSLVILQGGANDIFDAFFHSANPAAQLQINIPVALLGTNLDGSGGMAAQILKLQSAGAKNLVIANLPDIGYTPAFSLGAGGAANPGTQASVAFNQGLRQVLQQVGGNVLYFDTFSLFHEVQANAAAYGFTNTTTPACLTSSSLLCTPATTVPGGATNYFFADSVHPTTAAHQIWADAVIAQIQAPMQISMIPLAAAAAVHSQQSAFEYRLFPTGKHAVGTAEYFGGAVYSPYDISSNGQRNGIDAKSTGVSAGVDYQVSDSGGVGVVLAYSDGTSDFGNNTGNFKTQLTSLNAYGRSSYGPGYVFVSGGFGGLNFNNIHRDIALGPLTRVESGSSTGDSQSLKFGGGVDFPMMGWAAGPYTSLAYDKVKMKSYSEGGTDSTQLSYDEQTYRTLVGSIGVQARIADPAARFVPYVRLSYDYDFAHDPRTVAITSQAAVYAFEGAGYLPQRDSVALTAGVTTQLAKNIGLTLSATGILNQSDVHSYGVNAGVKATF